MILPKLNNIFITSVFLFFYLCNTANSTENPLSSSPQCLPDLEVRASRISPDPEKLPASVEVISKEDFDLLGVWYPGAELQGIPGITSHSINAGTNPIITFRGIPNRIYNDTFLLLVDGIPWLTTNDEVDFDQVPFAAVDHVEILKGTNTSIYGRGAVSGAINYVTHLPGLDPRFEGDLTFGSYGFRRLRLMADLPLLEDRDLLSLTLLSEGKAGWRPHTRRQRNSITLRNDIKVNDRTNFSLYFTGLSYNQGLAGEIPIDSQGKLIPLPSGKDDNYNVDGSEYKINNWGLTARLSTQLNDNAFSQSTLHFRNPHIETTNGFPLPYDEIAQTMNWSGFHADYNYWSLFCDQQFIFTNRNNRFLVGISFEQENGNTTEDWTGEFNFADLFYTQRRSLINGNWINQDNWISDRLLDAASKGSFASLYGEWENHFSESFTVKLGARYDYFTRKVDYHPTVNGFGEVSSSTVKDENDHLSSLLSLIWHPTNAFMAYMLYGEGYNPAFGPVWSFNNRTSGLEPEITNTYEIGLKKLFGADHRLALELAGYVMLRHDLMVVVPGQGGGRQVNAGKQRSIGLESRFSWQAEKFIKGAIIYGSLNLVDSEWQDFEFYDPYIFKWYSFTDNKVAGVPFISGKIGWEQKLLRYYLTFRTEFQYYGDYWYDNANTVKKGKYGLLNSSLSWAPAWLPRVNFLLTATNLLNKEYRYAYGDANGPLAAAPGAPLEFMGELKIKW